MDEGFDIKRKLMIVEDEPINLRILKNIIGDDYEIIECMDGSEAMIKLSENSDSLSLILLDLMIPDVNGFKILEFIRKDKVLRLIPVIVCTSEIDAEAVCLQMGAADFIAKPYDHPAVIRARIKRAIELHEGRGLISATQNDNLTGLLSHDFFMEYSSFRDQYYPQSDMDAVVLNVNKFHLINELEGRSAGDNLLKGIASAIREIAETKRGIAGRGGADEFLLYIPHGMKPEELVDKVSSGLEDLLVISRVFLRVGVYEKVDKSLSVEERFDRARHACNSLRGNYTVRHALYDKEMHEREAFQERLVNDMEKGLSEGQFIVYYQPKFSIQGDRDSLYSAEALVRWNHPEFGMISPTQFIPVFEDNGLIHKLDHFIWNEVAKQIGEWIVKYDFRLSVSTNVSRVDIIAPDLENEIYALVQNNWITPDLLNLEITESAYTGNSDQIIKVVQALRDKGFSIEMDDFGTGYSSLNMISSLPIDILKLDMQFVKNIHISSKDMRLVELMLEIARFLKVKVVAEGVEHKEQYELLKKAGCDIIQGFYFSKPVPPGEFERFIKEELSCRAN